MRTNSSSTPFIYAFAMAALLLGACNGSGKNVQNDSILPFNDSTEVFDTSNIRQDTSKASDTSPIKKPGAGGEDTVRFSQHN